MDNLEQISAMHGGRADGCTQLDGMHAHPEARRLGEQMRAARCCTRAMRSAWRRNRDLLLGRPML